MRQLFMALVVLVSFILQTTLLQYIEIRGILPNTAVILIVSYALLRGSTGGVIVGLCCGLLQDIFFGNGIGYYALLGVLTGYFAGRSHKNFYRENYIFPIIICAVATALYETVIFVTGFLLQGHTQILYFLVRMLLPECVSTAILTVPLYRLLFAVNEWLELKEKYKYRLF